jgi:adenylate kinase family enzyme
MERRHPVGRRIAIYGPTGSGKTSLGHTLGQRLGLSLVELDAIFWLSNWQAKELERFKADVAVALAAHPEGWVSIGNYSQVRDIVLAQADTVLWLRLPFRVTFWRLFRRTLKRLTGKEHLWGTNNTESWRRTFLSRDSILLWAITSRKSHVERTQRNLRETPHHAQVMVLRSARAVRAFMKWLPRNSRVSPPPWEGGGKNM